MEIGVYSFVAATANASGEATVTPAQRLRDLIEEIELADQVGLDVFGIGEHHRVEYVSSAPAVVLAAAARLTERIRLTSAVSVLSSDDPVRVFQSFATLDLLSEGRAEIMAGRGSFIESFPLFGYDLDDYNSLFAEKLELLLQLRESERVTWSGKHRAAIDDRPIYPRPVQDELPIWVAVGGTPESVVRAATLGLPMALAIIGGQPERFVPYIDLYRRALVEAGHDTRPTSINGHGYLADTTERAIEESYPPHAAVMNAIGAERGWPPTTREQYEAGCGHGGPYLVGDPATVTEKILRQHELFGHERLLLQLSVGTMPHENVMHAIELLGTEVAPTVRAELSRRAAPRPEPGPQAE